MSKSQKPQSVVAERPISEDGPHGLKPGDLFTVQGSTLTYKFHYIWLPDGSVSSWGPVVSAGKAKGTSKSTARNKSFRPEDVASVNGVKIKRKGASDG